MGGVSISDQRRHTRFRAEEGAFAVLRNHATRVGQILDISKGGLAFTYVADGLPPNGRCALDIFVSGRGYGVRGIPYRTVTDFELDKAFYLSCVSMRRRGIQFMDLTEEHQTRLDDLIQNHTLGRA